MTTISNSSSKYVLKSVKSIEFYNKNPHLDFNSMNDLFVDVIQKVNSAAQSSISVNEIKTLLHGINNKVDYLEQSIGSNTQIMKMTYDTLSQQKEHYIEQMKKILEQTLGNNDIEQNQNDTKVLTLIRETNETMIDKTIYHILQQFPKLNDMMKNELRQVFHFQQSEIIKETQRTLEEIMTKGRQDNSSVEHLLSQNYQQMSHKIQEQLCQYLQQSESNVIGKMSETQQVFQGIGKDMQQFLEKQKNSTLKGKESEEKLESCLVSAFPHGEIICQSGRPQSCDYLLRRNDKPDILFENKDYANNVPHEEIKKFIRDVEYQGKHGILLSQHSGVAQKSNYQIDVHCGHILVYVHFANYDETKTQMAVCLIDHLHQVLENQGMASAHSKGTHISMEELSEINKEYLSFIGHKKSLIEITKKTHREQLKAIEDFEMPKLTQLLNSKFTNVEQLSYKCEICGLFIAKNKRALVSHKNKCKKKMIDLNTTDTDTNLLELHTDMSDNYNDDNYNDNANNNYIYNDNI